MSKLKLFSIYLWKNPLIGVSFLIITLAILVSVLGANIRPDSSIDANNQIHQISRIPPGTKINFLKIRKNKEVKSTNYFGKLFFGGEESTFRLVPFYDYKIKGLNIELNEYTADSADYNYVPKIVKFNLLDVIYPINSKYHKVDGDEISFTTIEGSHIVTNIDELNHMFSKEHLVTKTFYFGTDKHGRDLLSRLMAGTIVSLSIGLISVLISFLLGLFFGTVSGFYGGRIDDLILWFINVVWSIPGLLLVISLTLILGKGFVTVFIAVGLTMWVELARVVRGQVIALRGMDYVMAGKALGFSNFRIITKHIIPNLMDPVIVICAANFATAILIEAGLSFLGIGVQLPTPSWGAIIEQHKEYIMSTDKSFLALFPGFLIISLVFSFMILGHHLREVFGQKSQSQSWNENLKGAPIEQV